MSDSTSSQSVRTLRAPGLDTLACALVALLGLGSCGDESPSDSTGTTASSAGSQPSKSGSSGSPESSSGSPKAPAAIDPALARALAPPLELSPAAGRGLLDEASQRGLDYVNVSGEPQKATILEANGAGVALFDLDADGDLDVAFGQGLPTLAQLSAGPGADLVIFRNDGTGNFERAAGPGLSGWWTGLASGDVDGDGDADLVCGGFGSLRVVLQQDGRLIPGAELIADPARRLTPGAEREPGLPPDWVTSVALFDADRDGRLDLYAGLYLDLDPLDPTLGEVGEGALALPCRWKGLDVYCGPHGLVPQGDRVFSGLGDGSFEDRTESWLPGHTPGFTLAVGAADCDGDGDTDLYVANDSTANMMLVNEIAPPGDAAAASGDGQPAASSGALVDYGLVSGVAVSQDGAAEAGMGVAWGDVDRDGRPDLCVTNFSDEPTALYYGSPSGFTNQTYRWGLNRATRPLLSWGVDLVDLDGDGWLELFTANGHVYPQADAEHTHTSYGQRDTVWSFGYDHRVLEWPNDDPSSVLAPRTPTRGSAVGDIDGDGRPDLVLARLDAACGLGINQLGGDAHWLEVRLSSDADAGPDGAVTPRDALGARVICAPRVAPNAPEYALHREVQTSGSFQSASSPYLSFGLGAQSEYAQLIVLWPSGRVEELGPGSADRRLFVEEGRGIVCTEELR